MNRTVLVTGGARGIGREIAKEFYNAGYNVAINYNKSEKEAQSLLNELPGSIIVKGDVSKEEDVRKMVEKTISHFGKIDVLVNNAGISQSSLVTDTTVEEWEKVFSVNVTGTFLATKYVSREMIKDHSGKIINISSMWGISGSAMESCYSASKGAVIAFTKALAKELGPSGITVNCVAPGFIDTDMNKNISKEDALSFAEETPLGRNGEASEVSKSVLFLASSGADFITGQILGCDGGAII